MTPTEQPDAHRANSTTHSEPASHEPQPKVDRWAHRRGEPRTFAAIWTFYMLGACVASIGTAGVAGLLSVDVYRPAARILALGVTMGLWIGWPMVRLSQAAPKKPASAACVDACIVLGPVLAMLCPQGLSWMAGWAWESVAVVSLYVSAWGLLAAGFLAFFFGTLDSELPGGWMSRTFAMLILVAVLSLGPGIALVTGSGVSTGPDSGLHANYWLLSSPVGGVYEMLQDRSWSGRSTLALSAHWWAACGVWAIAAVLWAFVRLFRNPSEHVLRDSDMASAHKPA